MALDKVVDSAALDAGMTAVADAIRAKGGTTEPLSWPDGFKAAVESIITGSIGSELPEPKLLCTLTAEMNLKEILTAHPIPRKYKRSFVVLVHRGTNIATIGSGTYRQCIFYCCDGDKQKEMFIINAYSNSVVAPDTLGLVPSSSGNGTYFSINSSDGAITSSTTTNASRYFAVGNTLEYIEIPFNYNTMQMDTTEWGKN